MAVFDFFVDSDATSSGNGTQSLPFRTLAEANTAANHSSGNTNRLHLKSGCIFHELVPQPLTNTGGLGLVLDVYGGSKPATIDGTIDCTDDWTYNSTFDFYTATLGVNDGFSDVANRFTVGAVLEDGRCLPMKVYNSNHTTLRNSLQGGGYAYDWVTGIVYMYPTSVPISNNHTYRVATKSILTGLTAPGPYGISSLNDSCKWNRHFQGIVFQGCKRHGINISANKTLIEDCGFFAIGGQQLSTSGATHLGNAIEAAVASNLVVVRNCWFDQIFDTGVAGQTFGSAQVAENILVEDCKLNACGLDALDFSIQVGTSNPATITRNIIARRNHITNSLDCFAPAIYPGRYFGIGVIHNDPGTLDNIVIVDNLIEDLENSGISVSWSGAKIYASKNIIRRCATNGIAHFINEASTGEFEAFENEIEDCANGLRVNSGHISGTTNYRNNTVTGCDAGFSDGSSVNCPVALSANTFHNCTTAISASRTTGITDPSPNFATGTTVINPTYNYLFS